LEAPLVEDGNCSVLHKETATEHIFSASMGEGYDDPATVMIIQQTFYFHKPHFVST